MFGDDWGKGLLYMMLLAGVGLVALFGAICFGLWFLVNHLQWVG